MNGSQETSDASRSRVLLVEDDEVFADIVMEIVRPLAEMQWTATAEQALGALAVDEPADVHAGGVGQDDHHSERADPRLCQCRHGGGRHDRRSSRLSHGAHLHADSRTLSRQMMAIPWRRPP